MVLKVTNYAPTVKQCGNSRGITASQHKGRYGFCAASKHWKFGTIWKLDTGEYLIKADTGSKVKEKYKLDRWNPLGIRRPIVSRGVVVYRGGGKNRYLAVKNALLIRAQLIKKDKRDAARGLSDKIEHLKKVAVLNKTRAFLHVLKIKDNKYGSSSIH